MRFLPSLLMGLLAVTSFALHAEETITDPATKTTFPKNVTITHDSKTYNLSATGIAVRSKFFVHVYSIAHYIETPPPTGDKEKIFEEILEDGKAKELIMKWVHNADISQVQDGYNESFSRILTQDQSSSIQSEINKFISFNDQNVKVGDEHILRWLPGGYVEVIINGTSKGNITNVDFAKALWSIWLGPKSVVNRNKLISFLTPSD